MNLVVANYSLIFFKLQDEELSLIGQFALEAGMMCWSLASSGFAQLASTATIVACLLSSVRIEGKYQFWGFASRGSYACPALRR